MHELLQSLQVLLKLGNQLLAACFKTHIKQAVADLFDVVGKSLFGFRTRLAMGTILRLKTTLEGILLERNNLHQLVLEHSKTIPQFCVLFAQLFVHLFLVL